MSAQYALLRSKAQLACESRITKLLFSAAKQITQAAGKYRRGNVLSNEQALLREAQTITSRLADGIECQIHDYAVASTAHLNISSGEVESFLTSEYYGKTSAQRTAIYLRNFAEDIVRMSKAGIMMGYTDTQLLSSVRTGYKNPYLASVITKARTKDISIATPSYGKGIFHSAFQNITRNARQMVAVAWGIAEQQYGKESGAIGFTVHRGSSYPCAVCDDETAYVHHFGDPFPPFHNNCVCLIKFIYNKD